MPIAWWGTDKHPVDNVFIVAKNGMSAGDRSLIPAAYGFDARKARRRRQWMGMGAALLIALGLTVIVTMTEKIEGGAYFFAYLSLGLLLAGLLMMLPAIDLSDTVKKTATFQRERLHRDILVFDRRDRYFMDVTDTLGDYWPKMADEMRRTTPLGERLAGELSYELAVGVVAFAELQYSRQQRGAMTPDQIRLRDLDHVEDFADKLRRIYEPDATATQNV